MAQYNEQKPNLNFQYAPYQIGTYKISSVFRFSSLPESLFLEALTMPIFYYETVYAKLKIEEFVSTVNLSLSLHHTYDDAFYEEDIIGFVFANYPKIYPIISNLIFIDGPSDPDVEGMKAQVQLLTPSVSKQYTIYKCDPGF